MRLDGIFILTALLLMWFLIGFGIARNVLGNDETAQDQSVKCELIKGE